MYFVNVIIIIHKYSNSFLIITENNYENNIIKLGG